MRSSRLEARLRERKPVERSLPSLPACNDTCQKEGGGATVADNSAIIYSIIYSAVKCTSNDKLKILLLHSLVHLD